MERTQLSVSEYIAVLNAHLGELYGEVFGEISEMKISARGHAYFVIKDKETNEILPCTMWQRTYALNGLELEVGMEVLARGVPEFYGPFGKLSFIAKSVELVGEGALQKAYEKLKKKLTEEGLFAKERKRPLPVFPKIIGVITSVRGEVIHDFTSNLRKAGFTIKIFDCRVEGQESGRPLTLSVRAFRREKMDILVLIRGGGSMQSLAGFNNEALVREVVSFPVPVIVGIGHHHDVTLAALAADAAESTPSFVAALLNKSWDEAEQDLKQSQELIVSLYEDALAKASARLQKTFEQAGNALNGILRRYEQDKQRIIEGLKRVRWQTRKMIEDAQRIGLVIAKDMSGVFDSVRSRYFVSVPRHIVFRYISSLRSFSVKVHGLSRVIQSHDPERQLRLGYSIVSTGGNIVRSIKGIKVGADMNVRVSDGTIISEIKEVK